MSVTMSFFAGLFIYVCAQLVGSAAGQMPMPAPAPAIAAVGRPLDSAVARRSIEELTMSQAAMWQAQDSTKSSTAIQQSGVARRAVALAEKPYEKLAPIVPDLKAQALQVRKYAFQTSQLVDHVKQIAGHFRYIADDASEVARRTVQDWIKADAARTAVRTSKSNSNADRLAGAVAAAAEPYHLALLRNQKFCAEVYSKAKAAQTSSGKLIDQAKGLALKAQELQASGVGLDAQATKATADGMMTEAENLRQWSFKLYAEANTACGGTAGYQLEEVQAATNAAATTIINKPMKLPPKAALRR